MGINNDLPLLFTSDEATEFLWTDIHDPTWYIPFFFTNVASNSIQVHLSDILDLSVQ